MTQVWVALCVYLLIAYLKFVAASDTRSCKRLQVTAEFSFWPQKMLAKA